MPDPLGDMPIDSGMKHTRPHSDADYREKYGYREPPTRQLLRAIIDQHRGTRQHLQIDLIEALEQARIQAFLSPVNDVPFRGNPVQESSGVVTVAAGGTVQLFTRTVTASHVLILRDAEVTVFDPSADDDLRLVVEKNDNRAWAPFPTGGLRPSSFFGQRNFYSKVLQDGARLDIDVTNNGGIQHDIQVVVYGWEMPTDLISDNSRSLMNPK